MRELGGWLENVRHLLDGGGAAAGDVRDVGDVYTGPPLEGPITAADFAPGGRYFTYAAIGAALLAAALIIQFTRMR